MTFDLVSFAVGIAAGGLTGTLAGLLYGLERTADLQEKVVKLSRDIERIDPTSMTSKLEGQMGEEGKARLQELRAELESIHEEIRKMYRKTTG